MRTLLHVAGCVEHHQEPELIAEFSVSELRAVSGFRVQGSCRFPELGSREEFLCLTIVMSEVEG